MERQVWKYEVGPGAHSRLMVPPTAEFLHAAAIGQDNQIYAWARVPVAPHIEPSFRPFGYFLTGESIPEGWAYVDTVILRHGGGIADDTRVEVLHVFDGGRIV